MKAAFVCVIIILLIVILLPESKFSMAVRQGIDPFLPEKLRTIQTERGNSIAIYFTPSNKEDPNGIDDKLIDLINSANTEIKAAIYSLNLDNITDAFINAKLRGVKVGIVYDESNMSDNIAKISNAGINVVYRRKGGGYMHNKFLVIDGRTTWTGSMNMTPHGIYNDNNNVVLISSEKVAANYSTEFDEMFDGLFGGNSPKNTPFPRIFADGTELEIYFAPEDNVEKQVINELDKAREQIVFMAFSFTSDAIGKIMAEKIKAGVKVKGIFEKTQRSEYTEYEFLKNAGADVQWDTNSYNMHHKVIVIDGAVVITGSYNFSKNANTVNDENCIIIHDRGVAGEFLKEYERLLN